MNDFLFSVLSGLIGGLVVWGIQQWYSNRRERLTEAQQNIITPLNFKKIVTHTIIETLKPGHNLNLAHEMLGQAIVVAKEDTSVFSDDIIKTNSYLYIVKNAYIKITSKDNQYIDSLTVFPNDTSFVFSNIPNPLNENEITLNISKMPRSLDGEWDHSVIVARNDETFALTRYAANPFYQTYTYFGYFDDNNFNWRDYNQSGEPSAFTGGTLVGLCISNEKDNAFYIYSYELR